MTVCDRLTACVEDEIDDAGQSHGGTADRDGENLYSIDRSGRIERCTFISSVHSRVKSSRYSLVSHNEKIDAGYGEAFPNIVVCVLELTLHDCRVQVNNCDPSKTSDQETMIC